MNEESRQTITEAQADHQTFDKRMTTLTSQVQDLTAHMKSYIEKSERKSDKQEDDIKKGIDSISDTKNLMTFGFIVLLFMMGALVIDVVSNIFRKDVPSTIIIDGSTVHR